MLSPAHPTGAAARSLLATPPPQSVMALVPLWLAQGPPVGLSTHKVVAVGDEDEGEQAAPRPAVRRRRLPPLLLERS